MNDDFYIGWEAKAPPAIGKFVRWVVGVLLIVVMGLALAFAVVQHSIGVSVFEWGTVKQFAGILKLQPYPHLLVPRAGMSVAQNTFSTYYLVAPFKHGLDREKYSTLDGKTVSLQGTLIYRGNQTMVEALPNSIKATDKQLTSMIRLETIPLGRQTLKGEIVDSKCFLGVMNPGQLLPHRACAIRCISGGIPPVLLVRDAEGAANYLLLVSADGKPVNQEVLDFVAEPVQITGEVERQGELLILRADPKTILRIK
jgi:hypothetical protein